MSDASLEQLKEYAAEDADVTFQLKKAFDPFLTENGVNKVFDEVENPLVPALIDMEFEGVGLNVGFLKEYSKTTGKDIKQAEENIYKRRQE